MSGWLIWLWQHPVFVLSLGGAAGTNARYWVGYWFRTRPWAGTFPWGTVAVNVSGSFLLGLAAVLLLDRATPARKEWFLLIGVGFCGGYTTFSTFELETFRLLREGRWGLALANVLASVLAGFVAVAVAVWLAQGLVAKE